MSSKEITFLIKHSAIYGLGTVLAQLVGFIMLPIYTRYLTPKDYGILNLIELSTFILGMVITTGIAQTLSRFYYEHEEKDARDKVVSTIYITYFFLSLAILPFLLLSSSFLAETVLDSKKYTSYFYISFISFVLGGLLDIGLTYLRIINKPALFVTISITNLIMLLSFNIYFIVVLKMGVLGILYSVLITRLWCQVVLTFPVLLKIKPRFSLRYALEMLKFSLPLIPAQLANTFVNQSDRYFIKYFISITDTGIYSLAQKLGTAIHMFITCSFQSVFEPRRFEIVKRPDAPHTFNKVFVYHAMALVGSGLLLSIFIPEILTVMVTPEFYRAGQLIPLIILSVILLGLRNHFEFGILWSKKTKYYVYINAIMAVVNVVLNFILIWAFGLWGAVYSSIITIIIHNSLVYFFGKKQYFIKFEFVRVAKLLSVALAIYGVSLLITTESIAINIILKSMLVLVFPLVLLWMKIITQEESLLLKKLYYTKIKPIVPLLNSKNL